jgi:hypothetical protein
MDELNNIINDVAKKSGDLRSNLETIMAKGKPWPQTSMNAGLGNSSGFLSPLLISPSKEYSTDSSLSTDIKDQKPAVKKVVNYEYEDWLGQKITTDGLIPLTTSDRFDGSKVLPKRDIDKSPYSMRDHYLIFNDNATDYFKHGLQVINELNPIENPANGSSTMRLNNFKSTPFENNDPVMYGFEIVIDTLSSPLLNGSISDFITRYQSIAEVGARGAIYQDFKHQFIKFFKTNGKLNIVDESVKLSTNRTNYASTDGQNNLYQPWRSAYMAYYLTKVDGLDLLSENNTASTKKYLTDYRKDVIKLTFNEDVSGSIGTLAHLYKLLYWSKPNGKNIIPENLLRFNCEIIVSELRNFSRVVKSNGDLTVIKDNLSRYVYSLKECQFYFNTNPHDNSIDMSDPKLFDNYSVEFDYKYSTTKFERFLEKTPSDPEIGTGRYSGYNNGAMWKVSKDRGNTGTNIEVPKFYTAGNNSFRQNGVEAPFVLNKYGANYKNDAVGSSVDEKVANQDAVNASQKTDIETLKASSLNSKNSENLFNMGREVSSKSDILNNAKTTFKDSVSNNKNYIERLKDSTVKNVKNEIAKLVNNRVNLLSRTINKLGIGLVGGKGVRPPNNVYTQDQGALGNALTNVSDRFFYDVRNELTDFAGDTLSNFLNNGINSFKKK